MGKFRTTPIIGENFFVNSKTNFGGEFSNLIWTCTYIDDLVVLAKCRHEDKHFVKSFLVSENSFRPAELDLIFNPIVVSDAKIYKKWEDLLLDRDPSGYVKRLEEKLKEFGFSGEYAIV